MNLRLLSSIILGGALGAAQAQAAPTAQPPSQQPSPAGLRAPSPSAPRGVLGTVTAVAADHYTIKTGTGDTYTVSLNSNTRILKQMIQHGPPVAGTRPGPRMLEHSDIKVGDTIVAIGNVDPSTKSIGAMIVVLIDPARARQMHEMNANYGTTWLMGRVTAKDSSTITILDKMNHVARSFAIGRRTVFLKHHAPATLADLEVGDTVRAEGAVTDGIFLATSVFILDLPPGGMPSLPRHAPPAATSPSH